jgi:hydrogenase maturation protease
MIVVVACGNANRSDDGVGAEVLRRLRMCGGAALSPHVKLFDAGADGMAVMFAARGARTLIVVDACRGAAEPGALFEVPAELLACERAPSLSTHDFRWEDALAVGRRILRDEFPTDAVVLLIEAASVDFGVELSPAVAAAAERAAERIEAMLAERLMDAGA